MPDLPHQLSQTVSNLADSMVELAFYDSLNMTTKERQEANLTVDHLREVIADIPVDDTNAIGLSMEDRHRILDKAEDSSGILPESFNLNTLRYEIEQAVCLVLHSQAETKAFAFLDDLETWLEDASFELWQVEPTNRFGWAAHEAERENEDTTVYEYRNVEGINVDVWQFRHDLMDLFVCEVLTES